MNNTSNKKAIIGLIILLLLVVIIFATTCNDEPRKEPSTNPETPVASQPKTLSPIEAYSHAKYEIEQNLKSPGSAEFPTMDLINMKLIQDSIYMIGGYVDAQNGFGGLMRMDYVCMVVYSPTTNKTTSELITLNQR